MMIRILPAKTKLVPSWTYSSQRVKVSWHKDFSVPTASQVASTAWVRTSSGVAEWARQSSEFVPEMEALQSPRPSQKIPSCVHRETDCAPFSNRTATTARPTAFQSSKNDKDKSGPLDIPARERRWYVVVYRERTSHEPEMISNSFTWILGSESHFHDSDGASQWLFVEQKCRKTLSNIVPHVIPEQWLEVLELGSNGALCETCWYKNDDTPADIRVVQGHCSRPMRTCVFF